MSQKLRYLHATLFTGLPRELRRGKSSSGYGDVVRGGALRGKHKQDAHVKPMLVAVMLHLCTMTEVQQSLCQAQEPFTLAGLQEACATKTGCFFSLQSRKSTRKYPHAWQVFGRSLPEFTLQASDLFQTAKSSFSGGGAFWQSRLRPAA